MDSVKLKHRVNLVKLEEITLALLVAMLALVVFYGTLVRYLPINASQMLWTQDVAQLIVIWVAFLGASVVQREKGHFKFDLILKSLRPKLAFVITYVTDFCILIVLALMAKEAFSYTLQQIPSQMLSIGLSNALFYLPLCLGSVLMAIYLLFDLILRIKNISKHLRMEIEVD